MVSHVPTSFPAWHMEHTLTTYPTWERCTVLSCVIASLAIRDRRRIFQLSRGASGDTFFPEYGFTLYEFAVWHTLSDARKKSGSKKRRACGADA